MASSRRHSLLAGTCRDGTARPAGLVCCFAAGGIRQQKGQTVPMWLGVDIGGANIKGSTTDGHALSVPLPLWKNPERLAEVLRQVWRRCGACRRVAVTMTGELADCFASRAEGVAFIVHAAEQALAGCHVKVYAVSGIFVDPVEALQRPMEIASANWHALAVFASRLAPRPRTLVLDIGSTTCDIIPVDQGHVVAAGRTDHERLMSRELVYTGVERTPVCALVDRLPVRQGWCPVTSEVFATTLDVYLLLGMLPERRHHPYTADGGEATREAAWRRMARMVGADAGPALTLEVAIQQARWVMQQQAEQLKDAVEQVCYRCWGSPAEGVVLAGHGHFLAQAVLEGLGWPIEPVRLVDRFGSDLARCASAYAVAVLAAEQQRE